MTDFCTIRPCGCPSPKTLPASGLALSLAVLLVSSIALAVLMTNYPNLIATSGTSIIATLSTSIGVSFATSIICSLLLHSCNKKKPAESFSSRTLSTKNPLFSEQPPPTIKPGSSSKTVRFKEKEEVETQKPQSPFPVFRTVGELKGTRTVAMYGQMQLGKNKLHDNLLRVDGATYRPVESTRLIDAHEAWALGNKMEFFSNLEIILVNFKHCPVLREHYQTIKKKCGDEKEPTVLFHTIYNYLINDLFTVSKEDLDTVYDEIVTQAKNQELDDVGITEKGFQEQVCIPIYHLMNKGVGYCAERTILFCLYIDLLKKDGFLPEDTTARYVRYETQRGTAHAFAVVSFGSDYYLVDGMWGQFLSFKTDLTQIQEDYPEVEKEERKRIKALEWAKENHSDEKLCEKYLLFREKKQLSLAWPLMEIGNRIVTVDENDRYAPLVKLPLFRKADLKKRVLFEAREALEARLQEWEKLSEFECEVEMHRSYNLVFNSYNEAMKAAKEENLPYCLVSIKGNIVVFYKDEFEDNIDPKKPLIPQIKAFIDKKDAEL